MLRELELKGKYERFGWPAQPRPDFKPPEGWSLPLITSVGRPRNHAPSPDGAWLAFLWDRADASDLYALHAAGGWPMRLTFDRQPRPYWLDESPEWSPDGRWLAFTDRDHVWVVEASGGLPTKISSFAAWAASPRWMPDSYHLLIGLERDERSRILLTDRDGSWPRPISQGPGHDFNPEPSPDGNRIAYLHGPLDDRERIDLMLVDLPTDRLACLSGAAGCGIGLVRWSPDGRRLALTSERTGFHELWLIDVETGREWQLTRFGHDVEDFAWSPDGSRLAATVNREGSVDLAVVEAGSGRTTDLRRGPGVHQRPSWLPDGRTITFEFEDPQHPPDLYRMDVESRQVTQLTFSNPPALEGLELVMPEPVGYRSLDGLEIPGFLYRPLHPNGAAIVYPHGGPTSQYILEWDIWAQYLVAKGYTWLAPNFRGSSGYGVAFERANHDVWGVKDTEDCLAAADYLAGLPWIDRKRLGLYGASYGSYLAVCALAYDPQYRFACAVAKYGDCNILTSWAQGEREAREEMERMMGHPAVRRENYDRGSPVWQTSRIRAPLLIVHGLQDPIVHPLQSEELVEALKREGKTFEYRTYPDEGHGLLLRKNQLDFYGHMERFVDWYLL
ncbi:MAG TPA: S9 family peptidase [Anaerolineales bacterium]|nr:S9 family peptidase [Anaerolineales bacterium]